LTAVRAALVRGPPEAEPRTQEGPSVASKSVNGRAVIWPLVLLVVIAGVFAWTRLGNRDRPVSIALITADSDPYWELLIDGAETAARELDVDITVMKADGTLDQQNKLINAAIGGDFDGLAVSPTDANAQSMILRNASEDHHLVTVDSDCGPSGRVCFVGAENYSAGRLCGEMVKSALPDGARVVIVMGPITKANGDRRRQGLIDELLDRSNTPARPSEPLEGPIVGDRYEIVATLRDDIDPAAAEANVRAAIEADPSINCVVGLYAYSAPAALRAIAAADAQGRVTVLGFDDPAETLAAIAAGDMYGTIAQDQFNYGFAAVSILARLSRYEGDAAIPLSKKMHFPPVAVTAANLEQFRLDRQADRQ
jgi:ribose transport system substrate-binding protein